MPRRRDPADRLEAARALADETPGRLERRILEELFYERVRVSVDMCELMAFERDLSSSIERALSACAESQSERTDLTLDYLQLAWERLSDEVLGILVDSVVGRDGRERAAGADPP